MINTLNKVVIFVAGAAVGSYVTWKLVKTKYERIAQEEIESVKEVYGRKRANKVEENEVQGDEPKKTDNDESEETPVVDNHMRTHYNKLMKNLGYASDSDDSNKEKEGEKEVMDRPYVIPPEEFGELDDYEEISLTYYSDRVLADEDGIVINDVDDVVGIDSLGRFGEYENDSVHVRNDRYKADYEILLVYRKYSDDYPYARRG